MMSQSDRGLTTAKSMILWNECGKCREQENTMKSKITHDQIGLSRDGVVGVFCHLHDDAAKLR